MRSVFEHVDRVRAKPHHIRRRVALGGAGTLTGLIAVVWLGASLATGTFALKGSNFAEMTGAAPGERARAAAAGATAGAAAATESRPDAPAHVEVVPSGAGVPAPTPAPPVGPTIIPF